MKLVADCVRDCFFATLKSGKITLSLVGNDSLSAIKKNKLFLKNILSLGPSKSFVSLHIGLSIGAQQGGEMGGGRISPTCSEIFISLKD